METKKNAFQGMALHETSAFKKARWRMRKGLHLNIDLLWEKPFHRNFRLSPLDLRLLKYQNLLPSLGFGYSSVICLILSWNRSGEICLKRKRTSYAFLFLYSAEIIAGGSRNSSWKASRAESVVRGNRNTIRFFVVANATAAVYGLLSLAIYYISNVKGRLHSSRKWLFFFDLMTTLLITSGVSAATAIGYVGLEGNNNAGWMKVCDQFEMFCHRGEGALSASAMGLFIFICLTVVSAGSLSNLPKFSAEDSTTIFKAEMP